MTDYYVTTSGSDSNNGLSEANAFATPGYACGQATVSGDIIYIKAGTYNLTSTTANISGGYLAPSAGVNLIGYEVTIGDDCPTGNRPLINNNGNDNSAGMIAGPTQVYNGGPVYYRNLHLDAMSDGSTNQWACYEGTGNDEPLVFINMKFSNGYWYGAGSGHTDGVKAINCHFYKSPQSLREFHDCFFEEASVSKATSTCTNSVFKNCGLHHRIPTITSHAVCASNVVANCIFYNEEGYYLSETLPLYNKGSWKDSLMSINNIYWGFGMLPWYRTASTGQQGAQPMRNVAYGNFINPLGVGHIAGTFVLNSLEHVNVLEITEDPFVDAANNDFRIDLAKPVSSQLQGISGLSLPQTTGSIGGLSLATHESSEPHAYYPFRFAASGSFETDVLQLHPLRENK